LIARSNTHFGVLSKPLAIDERAIGAAKVLDPAAVLFEAEKSVSPADFGNANDQVVVGGVGIGADLVLTLAHFMSLSRTAFENDEMVNLYSSSAEQLKSPVSIVDRSNAAGIKVLAECSKICAHVSLGRVSLVRVQSLMILT
jgi:hypothetical protein